MSSIAQNDIERAVHLPNTFSHPGHVGKAKRGGANPTKLLQENKMQQPTAQLPHNLDGYGFPNSTEKLVTWNYVCDRMIEPLNYWVCTITPEGRPHARPIWGVWVDEIFFFGGGPGTKWSRNLHVHPQVSINLEDGSESIVFEGRAKLVEDAALMERLDDAYEVKYNIRHGPPIWQLYPDRVFAWRSMDTMTKFVFG